MNVQATGIAATPEASDFTNTQERIADLKSADEVSTADARDARIEHDESAGWLAPVELEPKKKSSREVFVASSCEQGLRVHVSGRIPEASGLDRSSGETWKTRVGGEESSPDSGSPEPVSRVVAANDCRFRQASLRQQRDSRVPLQRCSNHDAQADHLGSVA